MVASVNIQYLESSGIIGMGGLGEIFLLRFWCRIFREECRKNGALTNVAGYCDFTAVQVSDFAANGEAKAKPEAALASGIIDLMKFFENGLEMLHGNTHAGIPDLDP